jgi:hypothetical protein
MVARARNHVPANTSLQFTFEIATAVLRLPLATCGAAGVSPMLLAGRGPGRGICPSGGPILRASIRRCSGMACVASSAPDDSSDARIPAGAERPGDAGQLAGLHASRRDHCGNAGSSTAVRLFRAGPQGFRSPMLPSLKALPAGGDRRSPSDPPTPTCSRGPAGRAFEPADRRGLRRLDPALYRSRGGSGDNMRTSLVFPIPDCNWQLRTSTRGSSPLSGR